MYLSKAERNSLSIGKVFRRKKGLRMRDPSAQIVPMPAELQEYYDELIGQGLQVKNLKFGLFQTGNGLKYPGLIATEEIYANTILVKVPVQSLLTTRDAFLSDIEKIFVENPAFFAKRFTSDWEDRIILTFLLYEYQKGKGSKWYNLIRNLPKDIDYAVFWTNEEIDYLEDEWMGRQIVRERKKFERDCEQLMRILRKYPQFFEGKTVSRENIIWLYTHLVTRCFGKYFEYTTMVPFAELFNHECVDVYYTMYYKPGNPHDEKEEFYEEKQLTQQDIDECESSDGSYDAEDFTQESEWVEATDSTDLWDIDLQVYGQQTLKDIKSILYHMYTFINFSDSISLNYVSQVLQELAGCAALNSWEARKKKCEQIHNLNVQYIRRVKEFYKSIKRKYYTYAITQKQKLVDSKPKEQDVPEEGVNYFEKEWPRDKFDQFYMLCSTKDQFQKGAQVFFCYGRLPNKLLLMRYGIALEHNKYDHMFIKIVVGEQVNNSKWLRTVGKEIQIKKYQRFKIKRTKMCVELVTYFRMQRWKYGQALQSIFAPQDIEVEEKTLHDTKQFYVRYLCNYKSSLQANELNLLNQQLGYHKYFGLVYKTEQQRMLHDQIHMIDYALAVLQRLRKGEPLRDILSMEKNQAKLTHQIMMEIYLKSLQAMTVF